MQCQTVSKYLSRYKETDVKEIRRQTLGILSTTKLYISVKVASGELRASLCGHSANVLLVRSWIAGHLPLKYYASR
jgi:hypothetical protein